MPIRPEMRQFYPDNWKDVRAAILERAGHRCEWCGVGDGEKNPRTGSKVVLTIMHLDHNPKNNDPDNLKAGCQLCHNSYDAPVRAAGVKARRRARISESQPDLFR